MGSVDRLRLDADSSPEAWRDRDSPGSFLTDDLIAAFNATGWCLVERAIDRDALRTTERELDELEDERNTWLRTRPARRSWISQADTVDFAPNLVAKSRLLASFSRSHPLIDICHDLIGPDVRLNFDQAVYKHPDTPSATLPFHQDNGYNFKRPEAYITIWIPFQDVKPDSGCLHVVPGVHRLGTLKHRITEDGFFVCDVNPHDAVAIPAHVGDLVVLSSLAPHATSGNRSERVRKAYLLSYVADGTRLRDGTRCDAPDTQYQVLRDGRTPRA
jgi:Protein involved in biosynthesis of mitomycin antibiotics/polyketide fumonisin